MQQNNSTFRAFRVEEINDKFLGSVQILEFNALNQNEVLVKVHYSSLNYNALYGTS